MHWAPVYSFCNPCQVIQQSYFKIRYLIKIFQVNLNTIIKFETLDDDTQYVLKRINASSVLRRGKKKNQTKGENSHNVAFSYLNQLGRDLYYRLIDIYKVDFLMFGYNITDYKYIEEFNS